MGSVNHYDPQLIDLFGAGDCSPEADVLQGTVFLEGGGDKVLLLLFVFTLAEVNLDLRQAARALNYARKYIYFGMK